MKNLALILLSIVCFTSCKKSECDFNGREIGLDYGMCVCRGGWFIKSENGDTARYYFYGDNTELTEMASKKLPYKITFSFKNLEGDCKEWADEITYYEIIE